MPIERARVAAGALQIATGITLVVLSLLVAEELGVIDALHQNVYTWLAPAVVIGGLLSLSRARLVLWIVAATLAAVVLVVAYTPVVIGPVRSQIRRDRPQPVDAVVILASVVTRDSLVSWHGLDRILGGVAVARDPRFTGPRDALPLVVAPVETSGGRITSIPDQRRVLAMMGHKAPVYWTPATRGTRDEALHAATIARRERWRRVAVVTSPIHSRRACGVFEHAGLRVTCVPAPTRAHSSALDTPRDRVRAFSLWFYEMAGTAYYKLRGWLP